MEFAYSDNGTLVGGCWVFHTSCTMTGDTQWDMYYAPSTRYTFKYRGNTLNTPIEIIEGTTTDSCNNRCTSHVTKTCIEFAIGRSDGTNPGRCYLYSSIGPNNGDMNYDSYTAPTKTYPVLTDPEKCVHRQAFSEDQDLALQTTCSSIVTKSDCIGETNV